MRRPSTAPRWRPRYPLALVTPADHYFLNSIFANVPRQQRRSGAPTLLIHPDDAAPRRIATGDDVAHRQRTRRLLRRGRGQRPHPRRRGRQPEGALAARLRHGATVNATVDERDSDMGGGAVYHDNRVQVQRVATPG